MMLISDGSSRYIRKFGGKKDIWRNITSLKRQSMKTNVLQIPIHTRARYSVLPSYVITMFRRKKWKKPPPPKAKTLVHTSVRRET